MIPQKNSYTIINNFINPEEVEIAFSFFPPIKDWFKFKCNTTSRTQSQPLTPKTHPSLFKFFQEKFNELNLTLIQRITPRIYQIGDFVDWHKDYETVEKSDNEKLIYEGTLVLKNTSDSVTRFKVRDSFGGDTEGKIEDRKTTVGDLILVCRNGIEHMVTKVTEGERIIVKFTAI